MVDTIDHFGGAFYYGLNLRKIKFLSEIELICNCAKMVFFTSIFYILVKSIFNW